MTVKLVGDKEVVGVKKVRDFFQPYVEKAFSLQEQHHPLSKDYCLSILCYMAREGKIEVSELERRKQQIIDAAHSMRLAIPDIEHILGVVNEKNLEAVSQAIGVNSRPEAKEQEYHNLAEIAHTNAYFSDIELLLRSDNPVDVKRDILKLKGDSVLGMTGFFPEFACRSRDSRDFTFYIRLGRQAYSLAAGMFPKGETRSVLSDLAAGFEAYVKRLIDVRLLADAYPPSPANESMKDLLIKRKIYLETRFQEVTN